MNVAKRLGLLILGLLMAKPLVGQQKIEPADAKNHIGELGTVCGYVLPAGYPPSFPPRVFIMGERFSPNFQIVIGTGDMGKFDPVALAHARYACATETIETNARNRVPEIVAHSPSQVVFSSGPARSQNSPVACKSWEKWDDRQQQCIRWRAPY